MQRIVKKLIVFALIEISVRLRAVLHRPFVFVAEQNARFRDDLRPSQDRPEQFYFIADVADFLVNAVFAAPVVRQHATIKFFRTDALLAPEEIEYASSAARNRLIGKQPDN